MDSVQENPTLSYRKWREETHIGKGSINYSYFSDHSSSVSSTGSSSVGVTQHSVIVLLLFVIYVLSREILSICMSSATKYACLSLISFQAPALCFQLPTGYFTGDWIFYRWLKLNMPKILSFPDVLNCFFLLITVNGITIPRASGKKSSKNSHC